MAKCLFLLTIVFLSTFTVLEAYNTHQRRRYTITIERRVKEIFIERRVKEIIAEQLGVDLKDVVPNASLEGDLHADIAQKQALISALEEEFHMEIPDVYADYMTTVQDVVLYICARSRK